MVSSPVARKHEQFEAECNQLLTALGLGFPVHLAEGADRGKDLVLSCRLGQSNDRVYKINVECKYREKGGLGPDAMVTKSLWARADGVDLLLIMTNTRPTAGAVDWLAQTADERSFPIVLWTGEYLKHLKTQLTDANPARTGELRNHVRETLAAEIAACTARRASATFDPRLEGAYTAPSCDHDFPFVNRDQELAGLSNLHSYRVAWISGVPGIGKSSLAKEVARKATEQGYALAHTTLRDDFQRAIETVAITLAKAFAAQGDRELLDSLRLFGVSKADYLVDEIVAGLQRNPVFWVVENAHLIQDATPFSALLKTYASSPGAAKLLYTSRTEVPGGRWLPSPAVFVKLRGFDRPTVEHYFSHLRVRCSRRVLSMLANDHEGWPLLVAEVGAQMALGSARGNQIARLLKEARDHIVPVITDDILAGVSPVARRVLSHIVALRLALTPVEMVAMLGCEEDAYRRAFAELASAGIVTPRVPLTECVHDVLRGHLRIALVSREVERTVAEYLSGFRESPERIAAAVEHYVRLGESESALAMLRESGEVLLRAGMYTTLIRLTQDLVIADQAGLAAVCILQCRALEELGRVDEALDALLAVESTLSVRVPDEVFAGLTYTKARLLYHLARYDEAEQLAQKGVAFTEARTGDWELHVARFSTLLGRIAYVRRHMMIAENYYNTALRIYAARDLDTGVNKVRHRLAMILLKKGLLEPAAELFRYVESEARRLGDTKRLSYALHRLGEIEGKLGNEEAARKLFSESIRIKKRIGLARGLVFTYTELTRLALRAGDLEDAAQSLKRALAAVTELDMPKEEATVAEFMAVLRYRQGDAEDAEHWVQRAHTIFTRIGLPKRAEGCTLEQIARNFGGSD